MVEQARQAAALPRLAPLPLCVSCGSAVGVVRATPLRSAVCGPCWATHGGQAAAEEIGPAPQRAVPVREPAGQKEWLDRLAGDPLIADRNRPTRTRLLALARELAFRAGWEDHASWPTWARLMDSTGWARSTMAGWLRELRLHGWLTCLEHGSTPRFRPMARADVEGNRAAVYALRIPLPADVRGTTVTSGGDKTWTPTPSFDLSSSSWSGGSSRARRVFHTLRSWHAAEQQIEALRARAEETNEVDFLARVPAGRAQMLAAAAQLRREHPILARLSPKAVRAECRPYWSAGWTGSDILHALRYRPTSWNTLPGTSEYTVIRPAAWVRSRLGAWRTEAGQIGPAASQQPVITDVIRQRHGRGGVAALPPTARTLTSHDIRAYASQHRGAAAETLARRRRREAADARSAPAPREQAASPTTRAAARETFRRDQHQRDQRDQRHQSARRSPLHEHLVNQARAHLARTGTDTPAARGGHDCRGEQHGSAPTGVEDTPDTPDTPDTRYQRALARARTEPRRHPHRR